MKATPALSATALVLLGSPTLPQTPLPKMNLVEQQQSLDGNPADVVGPSVVSFLDVANERVWGLQGRRREVWRVDTRERQHDEEDKDFATRLVWGAIDVGNLDPADDRLFTMTERHVQETETGDVTFPGRIKVDDISDPTAPSNLQDLAFPESEVPRYIATDAERDKLLVVMAHEVRIYDYSSGTLPDPLDAASGCPPAPARRHSSCARTARSSRQWPSDSSRTRST